MLAPKHILMVVSLLVSYVGFKISKMYKTQQNVKQLMKKNESE